MDAITFTTTHLNELKARLANMTNPSDIVNYGKTQEEIIQKFLDDQGIEFDGVDIAALIKLTE